MPMEQIEKQKERALASMAAQTAKQTAPTAHPDPKPVPYSDPTLPSLPTMPAAPKPAAAPDVAFPTSFAEVEPTEPVAARPKPAASVDDLGFGGGPSRSPVVERTSRGRGKQRPASRARGRSQGRGQGRARGRSAGGTVIMIGATIAAAFVFAIGYAIAAGIELQELMGLGTSGGVVTPSELPPVAPEPGLLVLDAQPWAEIVQIIDPLGDDVPLRFRHTPARYEVGPGTYTVIMSSPTGERETLELEVTSEQTTQARPEFKTLSVDEYFRLMGWR